MKHAATFCILLCLLFSFVVSAGEQDRPAVHFDRISKRTLILQAGEVYLDRVVAIAGSKGIAVIDTGIAPSLTAEYRKIIEREFGRKDFAYVINTHNHFDHTDGNQVFADATIVAHEGVVGAMKDFERSRLESVARQRNRVAEWKERLKALDPNSEQAKEELDTIRLYSLMADDVEKNYTFTLPSITFNDRLTLDLGDITLRLVYFGKGRHAGDDILIHCPEEKLLFSGDLFYDASMLVSRKASSDVEPWIVALNYALQDPGSVLYVYGGHQRRMSGEFLTLFRDYLVDLHDTLVEAKSKGLDFPAVEKLCAFDSRFSYLEKSGIDRKRLEQEHAGNVRYLWYQVSGMQSASEVMESTLAASGIRAVLEKFKEMRASPEGEYFFDETEINRLGYRLLADETKKAIEIFKLNVEVFPESWNVYDSLAEAYMTDNQNELAVRFYKKSLELNPKNENAGAMLKRLGQDVN